MAVAGRARRIEEWLPANGGGADLVVVALQESAYAVTPEALNHARRQHQFLGLIGLQVAEGGAEDATYVDEPAETRKDLDSREEKALSVNQVGHHIVS